MGGENSNNFCTADVPFGWILNNDDEDDACYSNYHDCAGVCNGSAQVIIYYFDADGDGLGDDLEQEFCSTDDISDDWVLNNDDEDDNCFSNIIDECGVCDGGNADMDCAGVCDGDAVVQTYWNDDDGDGLGDGIEEEFCSATVPDGWVLNNEDEDDNCFSNYHDCMEVCDGSDEITIYYWYNDGDGF